MKRSFLPAILSLATLSLVGCANVEVTKTYVASGATRPSNIYIRPFTVAGATFVGDHGPEGQKPIRQSLAPAELNIALKEELSKIAPAMIIDNNDIPEDGWIVDGNIDVVDGGSQPLRFFFGHAGAGRTTAMVHVRVTQAGSDIGIGDAKGGAPEGVLYAFDVKSSSKAAGPAGSVYSSGLGSSVMFDFRNIAEEVMLVLTPDPYRYGVRAGGADR
ncbi:MAG TPA: DUF4410 domain-containing protein [Chthoniobacterales bacterium]|jgi:hypothetical protein